MKKIHKILLTFLPLVIAILVWIIYLGVDTFSLQERGLKWRPYVTSGMLIIATLGQICFFLSLTYHLFRDLKNRKIWLKMVYMATIFVVGVITFHVTIWGLFFLSVAYEHEEVIITDDMTYVSCLSDWNPTTYHYYEYDSWFTIAAEPFKSIPVEQLNVDDN